MVHRAGVRALIASLVLLADAGSARPVLAVQSTRAEALYRRALRDIEQNRFDARRHAMKCLEQATLLAPDSSAYHLALGRLYMRMGFLGQARHRYERVAALRPDLAEAHLGLGLVWRRDYLKYLDAGSLGRALEEFGRTTRLAPAYAEAWLNLVPLLVEQSRLTEAMHAAEQLSAADPERVDGVLALAHVAFRLGQVERADSLFRAALPRLPGIVRDRYLDIAPVATERDTATLRRLPAAEREAFLQRFWRDLDSDLSTAENEVRLEYWSRVTQAYFLYFNPWLREWDERGEIYVRYGPPDKAIYNPVGMNLNSMLGHQVMIPMNVLLWNYPGLGMTVQMQDRLLSEYYLPPISLYHSTDPGPDPDSLARRTAALVSAGGRGVFPSLPPGAKRLPLDAVVARFEGEENPRLLGWIQSPGAPGDSMWGEWVVLDSTRAEVARLRRPLSPSACDAAEFRAADFVSEIPPGEYLAGFSVRAADGRRGAFRARVTLAASKPEFELSDVVVVCGSAGEMAAPAVRLSANPGARVGTGPLSAYFEAYHLTPGPDGLSYLEFEYTVRSADRDPRIWVQRLISPRRPLPDLSATRRERQPGTLRRQFVTVPLRDLPAGRYRLEIRVRDLNAGTEAVRAAEFVREGAVRVSG